MTRIICLSLKMRRCDGRGQSSTVRMCRPLDGTGRSRSPGAGARSTTPRDYAREVCPGADTLTRKGLTMALLRVVQAAGDPEPEPNRPDDLAQVIALPLAVPTVCPECRGPLVLPAVDGPLWCLSCSWTNR
jgi:hypothetical protein